MFRHTVQYFTYNGILAVFMKQKLFFQIHTGGNNQLDTNVNVCIYTEVNACTYCDTLYTSSNLYFTEDLTCNIESQVSADATISTYRIRLKFENPQFSHASFVDYDALPGNINLVGPPSACSTALDANDIASWTFPFSFLQATTLCGENWVTNEAGQVGPCLKNIT